MPEARLRQQLEIHLEEARFKVIGVENREQVLLLARSQRPALVLLDLYSPTKKAQVAFGLLRELKRSMITWPIPVIVFLAQDDGVGRIVAFELGADDCVTKPLNFRELVLRMKRSLSRSTSHHPQPRRQRPKEKG